MKILVVQTAFIGDVILITPLLRAIRDLYPQAKIDVMVVPGAARLLEHNPHINDVLSFAKKGKNATGMLRQIKLLRATGYDLAISPHSSGRTHLLLYLAGIPLRIGFDRGPAPFLLSLKIKHPQNMHKINKNLTLLKMLSPREFPMQSELYPSAADYAKAEALLEHLRGRELIAVAPGSIWETKCWPCEHYALLVRKLAEQGLGMVLIGGATDQDKCESIMHELANSPFYDRVVNLAGRTDLLESAAVISKCKLMICNDSGALHVANAMQTQVIAFFGPTVPAIGYYPYREHDKVFEISMNCRPCGSHGANKCPLGHHKCMKDIKVDMVLEQLSAELARQQ